MARQREIHRVANRSPAVRRGSGRGAQRGTCRRAPHILADPAPAARLTQSVRVHETRFDDLAAVDQQFRLLRQSRFVEVVRAAGAASAVPTSAQATRLALLMAAGCRIPEPDARDPVESCAGSSGVVFPARWQRVVTLTR